MPSHIRLNPKLLDQKDLVTLTEGLNLMLKVE